MRFPLLLFYIPLLFSCAGTPPAQTPPVYERTELPAQSPAADSQVIGLQDTPPATQLEWLWGKSRTHNSDLKSLEHSLELQRIQLEHHRTAYSPSLSLSSTTGFNDSLHRTKATATENSLSLTLPVVSGTSLMLGGSYTMTQQMAGTAQEEQPWNHGAGVTFGLVQSIYPYWLQGLEGEPHKLNLQTALLQSQEERAIAELSILKSLTTAYIQLRLSCRNSALYRHIMGYYNFRLESYMELAQTGQVDLASIWQEEENRRIQQEKLDAETATATELQKKLSTYCGISVDTANFLPKIDTEQLPPTTAALSPWNHQLKSLELEEKALRISHVQKQQETFPTLSASATISFSPKTAGSLSSQPWGQGQTINWSVTAAIDASSLLSSTPKKNRRMFQAELSALQDRWEALATAKENDRAYCTRMIDSLQQTKTELQGLLGNWKQKLADLQELYKRGGCSQLDVMTAEIQTRQKEAQLLNTNDQIWYYQWLQNNL